MRYKQIDSSLFTLNRENFIKKLKPKSLAIFVSNDLMPRSADQFHTFRQNPDLFYLSGIDQEETILLLFPDSPIPRYREVLFIRPTSEELAIWEGERYNKKQASEMSGIKNVVWNTEFDNVLRMVIFEAQNIYLNTNENLRASGDVATKESSFAKEMRDRFPLHHFERAAPIMADLRAVKSDFEIEIMQKACSITESGFRRILKMIKPGVMEFEVEAELAHEFIRNRADGFAYEPIIASGADSCVLHYVKNNKEMKDGDILLLDIGAEYANYASDLSRTVPVNGRYTKRQREVYDAVLRVFKGARDMMKPGITIEEINKETGNLVEAELIQLGLLNKDDVKNQDPEKPIYKKYFMHGTGHFLGIDTHDIGNRYEKLKAGVVLTCEPGIYIREEGLGVRIENDILLTEKGPVDLMNNIPIEAEEIEEIMNSR